MQVRATSECRPISQKRLTVSAMGSVGALWLKGHLVKATSLTSSAEFFPMRPATLHALYGLVSAGVPRSADGDINIQLRLLANKISINRFRDGFQW